MIFATDVHYPPNGGATAAGILYPRWELAEEAQTVVLSIPEVAEYQPGAFYKRELPCLLQLLAALEAPPSTVVIDGYVQLGAAQKPGLGWHLYEHLAGQIPVIGVAKSAFVDTPPECQLRRGRSQTPLYITAAGITLMEAKARIAQMHGNHRIPTLLKRVDQLCRSRGAP